MGNQIVNINVSITNPPKPSSLLKTGALVSVGGTTLAAGETQLLTVSTDLATILRPAMTISALAWATSVVTATTAADHGLTVGDTYSVTIAGNTPTGYNGTFTITVTGADTFTYPLTTDPGTATVFGTAQIAAVSEITQMNTSYWAQGTARSVYVLELGPLDTPAAVAALNTYVANDVALGNTYQTFFIYLVPRAFDTEATFKTLTNLYTSAQNLVYFWVTTTTSTYAAWQALAYKSVWAEVESPDVPDTEFSAAASFQSALSNNPGSSNQVPPMAFRFQYGTTVFPITGNATLLTQLNDANINYIASGAEGGLSNMILKMGHMLDGNPFNYWYSVAWAIINLELDLANEIINGSNTTVNPLYYEQTGIDRLQNRALSTLRNGISYGLILGTGIKTKLDTATFTQNFNDGDYTGECVVNAVPFTTYTAANESDYADGIYNGLTGVVTPKRDFESITFNLNVTNFVG